MLTEQEIFDFVTAKLRQQGRRSLNGSACAYRGADGCKCAIGHLIPDEMYRREFDDPTESTNVCDMMGNKNFEAALLAGGVDGQKHLKLLAELQSAHDKWYKTKPLEENLQEVAERNSLTYTPPAE